MRDDLKATFAFAVGVAIAIAAPVYAIQVNGTTGAGVCGATTQVQFNDAGACGANSGFTFDKSTIALTIGDGVITSNKSGGGFAFVHKSGNQAVGSFGYDGIRLTSIAVGSFSNSTTQNDPGGSGIDTGWARGGAAGVFEINNGTQGTRTGVYLKDGGNSVVGTQFDKTSDTTLANVTNLTATVSAGRTYSFEAFLFTASNVAGGVKAAIAGTATATAVIYQGETTNSTTLGANDRATSLGTSVGGVTTVTVAVIQIHGTITVNAAGTLTVQFAQNASNGAASSVLVGSYFKVWDTT